MEKNIRDWEEELLYKEMISVASSTECTGLIPATVITEAEIDSLRQIYNVPPGQKDILLSEKVNLK